MNLLNETLLWNKRLLKFFSTNGYKKPVKKTNKKKGVSRIAIILTAYYGYGGVFRGLRNIVKMIHAGSLAAGDSIEIVLSIPINRYKLDSDFEDLRALGVSIRETTWHPASREHLKYILFLSNSREVELKHSTYWLPDDGVNYLTDCDFWFLISDRTEQPLAPLRPYGMLIYDYIQRYMPSIFPADFNPMPFIFSARAASFVLSTMPFTRESVIQYAGVEASRAHLTPLEVDLHIERYQAKPYVENKDYIIWCTNSSPHKNQLNALAALDEYYSVHQGKFCVVMTGVNTKWFDLKAPKCDAHTDLWISKVRSTIEKSKFLKKNLIIAGELSDDDYIATLRHAKFLWHPGVVDAGTFCCVEAAYHGVPTLTHDYPPMRFYDERFVLNLTYFNARKPCSAGKALKDMELNLENTRSLLPSTEFLERYTPKNLASEFWSKFRLLMEESL